MLPDLGDGRIEGTFYFQNVCFNQTQLELTLEFQPLVGKAQRPRLAQQSFGAIPFASRDGLCRIDNQHLRQASTQVLVLRTCPGGASHQRLRGLVVTRGICKITERDASQRHVLVDLCELVRRHPARAGQLECFLEACQRRSRLAARQEELFGVEFQLERERSRVALEDITVDLELLGEGCLSLRGQSGSRLSCCAIHQRERDDFRFDRSFGSAPSDKVRSLVQELAAPGLELQFSEHEFLESIISARVDIGEMLRGGNFVLGCG